MTKLGTKMLSFLLKTEKAGACVPEHGNSCCKYSYGKCEGGRYYKYSRKGTIGCTGVCSNSGGAICNKQGSGEVC